jgi:hypothetical protein
LFIKVVSVITSKVGDRIYCFLSLCGLLLCGFPALSITDTVFKFTNSSLLYKLFFNRKMRKGVFAKYAKLSLPALSADRQAAGKFASLAYYFAFFAVCFSCGFGDTGTDCLYFSGTNQSFAPAGNWLELIINPFRKNLFVFQ